jgi:hypothetical protein
MDGSPETTPLNGDFVSLDWLVGHACLAKNREGSLILMEPLGRLVITERQQVR